MALQQHGSAKPLRKKSIPPNPSQEKRYFVVAQTRKDQDYTAISDEKAIEEGCRRIGAQKPYTAKSFEIAGGVAIYSLPSMSKLWPPTQN